MLLHQRLRGAVCHLLSVHNEQPSFNNQRVSPPINPLCYNTTRAGGQYHIIIKNILKNPLLNFGWLNLDIQSTFHRKDVIKVAQYLYGEKKKA